MKKNRLRNADLTHLESVKWKAKTKVESKRELSENGNHELLLKTQAWRKVFREFREQVHRVTHLPRPKHLQGPRWPQPGPSSWPCCCSAATPSALWTAIWLTPSAWPTGRSWCSCNNWEGSPLPPACRTEMTSHSPRRLWVAASCRRLKPSLCSMRWPSTPSSSSAQRARPPRGTRASWTSYALRWISSSLTCKPVWGRRRGCKGLPCSRRTPAWLWGNTSTDSLSIFERRDTALVPGRLSEQKSWEPSLPQQTCRRVSGERTDTHLVQHGNDSHEPTDHTSSRAAMSRTLISAVIAPWNKSIWQMTSGILSNIMFYSIGTGSSQMPKLIYLRI